jgi:hypothetical protein
MYVGNSVRILYGNTGEVNTTYMVHTTADYNTSAVKNLLHNMKVTLCVCVTLSFYFEKTLQLTYNNASAVAVNTVIVGWAPEIAFDALYILCIVELST